MKNMHEFERIYRHGDVVLYKLKNLPNKTKSGGQIKELILEEGEAKENSHRIKGKIEVLQEDILQKEIVYHVFDQAVLTHEEHDRMVLEQGIYLKVSQVEYNPFTDIFTWIRD